jgi:hypothetical protein
VHSAVAAAGLPSRAATTSAAVGGSSEVPSVLQQLYQGSRGTGWLSGGPQVGATWRYTITPFLLPIRGRAP